MKSSLQHHAEETKTLTWKDGFAMALVIPNGLFVTFGYLMGVIGAWTAICIWVVATVIGLLQNAILAELAAMFPDKPGGLAAYAIEGWRRYFAPLGAIASFGYWMGWCLSMSVTAAALGQLIQGQWFSETTSSVNVLGNDMGMAHVFGILALLVAWLLNSRGSKVGARANKIVGTVVLAGLALVIISPYLTGNADLSAPNLTWHVEGGWLTIIVIYYLTSWTTYGTEICATFAPEYKDTAKDTTKALMSSSVLMIALFILVPSSVAGVIGEQGIADNPVGYIGSALDQIFPGASDIGVLVVCCSLFIALMSGTAGASRALYGLANEGMTLKQFDHLNKHNVPGRALIFGTLLNIVILVLLADPVSILLASNFGYLMSIILAISSFLLLRKDRPDWPRPIRRGQAWIPIAIVLTILNSFVIVIGLSNPQLAGYGGLGETITGIAILLVSLVLYAVRQVIQDKRRFIWREETPRTPDEEHALPPAAADGTAPLVATAPTPNSPTIQ